MDDLTADPNGRGSGDRLQLLGATPKRDGVVELGSSRALQNQNLTDDQEDDVPEQRQNMDRPDGTDYGSGEREARLRQE